MHPTPDKYIPADYWEELARTYAPRDPLAAVCWDGAPAWFNRFFDHFHARTLARTMERRVSPTLPPDAQALDVGCGVGRSSHWLSKYCSNVVGVDISPTMVHVGRSLHPNISFINSSVTSLPFPEERFDLTASITMLQHLPYAAQEKAIAEMSRVVKVGGFVVLLELVSPGTPGRRHVFANPVRRWTELLDRNRLDVVHSRGQAYALPLRAAYKVLQRMPLRSLRMLGSRGEPTWADSVKVIDPHKGQGPTSSSLGRLRGAAALAARLLVYVSYPLEYLSEAVLGQALARNVVLVARKRPGS